MQTISFELAEWFNKSGLIPCLKYQMSWLTIGGHDTRVLLPTFEVSRALQDGYELIGAACSLDEILEMLPHSIEAFYDLEFHKSMDDMYWMGYRISLDEAMYWMGYRISLDEAIYCTERFDNPAEAAGQLLKWCIENDYVKVEDINNA